MSALIDIAEVTDTVTVGKAEITLYGLSAGQIAKLLVRFPKIRGLIRDVIETLKGELDVEEAVAELDHRAIGKLGSEAVGAAIAYATRADDDPQSEAVAARLPAGVQIEFLRKGFALTFPNGFREAMPTILTETEAE
jgi:hypothetical protein